MKRIKQLSTALLAMLVLASSSVISHAQTTNWMVYNFNTNQVAENGGFAFGGAYQGWGNWFGGVFNSANWDSTVDASNNVSSGSMKVQITPNGGDQYVLFDGFFTYSADMYNIFTNLSFDIRYDASSAIRTNATLNDGSTGIGSQDFGDMRVGAWDNWNQDWYYYFAIPATNGLGQPNTNWTHISIPINQSTVLNQYPNLATITDVLIGMDAGNYGNSVLHGSQTYWIDNVQFIGPAGGIVHAPPTMGVEKSKPALRNFIGSASIFARSQLASTTGGESWVGAGTTYPVTYSFTLLDFPNVNQVQAHIEVIPGSPYTGNPGADYNNNNSFWLQILSDGAGGYTANISWKTNSPGHNPPDSPNGHTELAIAATNSPAGTWTLTFNSATTGTLSGPGTNNVHFTINDPNVAADFGNPAIVIFGNQPNGVAAGEGLPSDYSHISVTGVAGGNINDDFTTAATFDPVWTLGNSDTTNTTVLVTTNTPYWINWSIPDNSFGLAVSPDLVSGPWHLPEYYNGYFDLPFISAQGPKRWALIPNDCLPTVDAQPQSGQALSPNAFFRLSSPAPSN
jgi:hypothetical protein